MDEQKRDRAIHTLCLGHHLTPQLAETELVSGRGAVRYRDAYYLKYPKGEAWFFDYGVLVCWDLSTDERQQLMLDLCALLTETLPAPISEEYRFQIAPDKEFKIQHDLIILNDDEPLTRLALSHAFAQSMKLQFFEERAQRVVQQNSSISKELAATGRISINRRRLAKLRGLLFDTSSDITLHFNLLDTPEFFWDYPEVEGLYQGLAKYLDLKPRIDLLNYKLSTIHEMLDMLASEQHHKHAAFLEWIIIILIAVEIVIYFFPGH